MKTVVVIPFSREVDQAHLSKVLSSAGGTLLVCSAPSDAVIPILKGVTTERISHKNAPEGVINLDRVGYYLNHILVPLAISASRHLKPEDKVLLLHENVAGSDAFKQILAASHGKGFASARPRTYSTPGDPTVIKDYSDRCVAWSANSFKKYQTVLAQEPGFSYDSTMEFIMEMMDQDKVPYIWTDINIEET